MSLRLLSKRKHDSCLVLISLNSFLFIFLNHGWWIAFLITILLAVNNLWWHLVCLVKYKDSGSMNCCSRFHSSRQHIRLQTAECYFIHPSLCKVPALTSLLASSAWRGNPAILLSITGGHSLNTTRGRGHGFIVDENISAGPWHLNLQSLTASMMDRGQG